jgi:hypothetical protein
VFMKVKKERVQAFGSYHSLKIATGNCGKYQRGGLHFHHAI